jgi:glutaredoxin
MTRSVTQLCTVTLLAAVATGAMAQQVYRHVGPDGRVVYSDQPPAANTKPAATGAQAGAPAPSNTAALPFELRQVVQRYPVTLYTGAECAPCDTGRSMLTTRGIPFDERTVKTAQDSEALQRLSGQSSLPLLAIGTQQLKGFSDAEWTQYLDAAGYPKSSQLPAGYRTAPAAPLVAQQPAPAARVEQRPAPAVPAAPPPAAQGPTPDNPAGIKF